MADEDVIKSYEEQLKGEMPEECVEKLKKFEACRLAVESEEYEKNGYKYMKEHSKYAFNSTNGCRNEYNAYIKCKQDFFMKYVDLKNYVAEIKGENPPFDKKDLRNQYKKNLLIYNKY